MSKRGGGRRWRRLLEQVFITKGDTCWICGHTGADSGGHVLPVKTHPHLEYDPDNVRPEHLTQRTKRIDGYDCPGNINRGAAPPPTNQARSRQW